ncbi:MAG: cell division protein FtsZ, partial [Comamonadaceae bacterium]|nr:cell division protein FtsZ [Comamonadaceae bacterium]
MSTLQLSLAIIGGIVLAVVVAYNAWNNHRNTPRRAQPESREGREGHAPALPPEPVLRQEPSFDGAVPPAPMALDEPGLAPADAEVLAQQHVPTMDAHDALHIPAAAPAHERRLQLDPLIDAMASLLVENLVSGDAALAAVPPTRRAGSKPFGIEGFNATTKLWEPPQPGQRY